jgi:hypothetical protein
MISQSGTINGVVSTEYRWFDEDYPDRNNPNNNNFIPYFAISGRTGRIYAKSGAIGGFAINQKDLVNVDYDAGITIRNQYETKQVQLGSTAIDPYTNRLVPLLAKMIDTDSGGSIPMYNTALCLDARNATYNYAFHGNGNGVLNGYMQGYKVKNLILPQADTAVQLKLGDGMIQAVTRVYVLNHRLNLPTLGEVKKTLAIESEYGDFCCELILINQSEITAGEGRNVVVYGDENRSYSDIADNDNALPVIIREQGQRYLELRERYNAHFFLTYINRRYIANYIYG